MGLFDILYTFMACVIWFFLMILMMVYMLGYLQGRDGQPSRETDFETNIMRHVYSVGYKRGRNNK